MSITLSGVVSSSFDWQTMISQLQSAAEASKVNPLTKKQDTLSDRLSAWQSLADKLSALQTAAEDIQDADDFDLFKTTLTSSNSSVAAEDLIKVTAGSGANIGQFDVQVSQLATAEKLQSVSVAAKDSATGWTGSIVIGEDDPKTPDVNEARTIELDGKSLIALRDEINALDSGDNPTGVTASILRVGEGDYRLILTADETGADGITLTDAPGNYFNDTPLQDGKDAIFSIDGISMTRSSNEIDDALPGVTLTLVGAEEPPTTTVSVRVTSDTDAVKKKIQTFVDAYNGVMDFISDQMSYNTDTKKTGGALFGDTTLKSIKSNIQNLFLNSGLSEVGITTGTDNTLTIDSDALEEALASNPNGTIATFNTMATTFADYLDSQTDSIDGTVVLQENSIQKNIDRLTDRIATAQEHITAQMALMTKQFQAMDVALSQMESTVSILQSLSS